MIRFLAIVFSVTLVWPLTYAFFDENSSEYGKYFEGDMILNEDQKQAIFIKNGLIAIKYRWPNKTIPYQLSPDHTEEQHRIIETELQDIASQSCLKIVRRTTETSYVNFTAENNGCYSDVGYQNKPQKLNLGKGCVPVVTHEFMHALGFHHMQSAFDRDDYVTIQWDNIIPGKEHNFIKYNSSIVTHFNTTYDYFSIMHYNAFAFSKNYKPTIIPNDKSYLYQIGQRFGLSDIDVIKLNRMYECGDEYLDTGHIRPSSDHETVKISQNDKNNN